MSTIAEISEIPEKYTKYKEQLGKIFKEHEIDGIKSLISKLRKDDDFRKEWIEFWEALAKADGGKLSLPTIGIILGALLGGVGIAAMGGAIGLPLALILGLGGFVGGSTFDSFSWFGNEKKVTAKISKEAHLALEQKAEEFGLKVKEYAKVILEIQAGKDAEAILESDADEHPT